jgi:hypothetical protein
MLHNDFEAGRYNVFNVLKLLLVMGFIDILRASKGSNVMREC